MRVQVVLAHFQAAAAAAGNVDGVQQQQEPISRVIIFTTLRDSVKEVVEVLARHSPLIKPK